MGGGGRTNPPSLSLSPHLYPLLTLTYMFTHNQCTCTDRRPLEEGRQQQQELTEKQVEQQRLQEKRRDIFGPFLSDLPDNALRVIASKWEQGKPGPIYDDELAVWMMEVCGYFPLCWDLDEYLYPLLQIRPHLALLLILGLEEEGHSTSNGRGDDSDSDEITSTRRKG